MKEDAYLRNIMKCNLPEDELNDIKISRFNITEEDAILHNFRFIMHPTTHRRVIPGTYTKLTQNGILWMTDTPTELNDHITAVKNARGICFVSGLGLGCVVQGMLEKKTIQGKYIVDKVIVVEKNIDIINLVGKALDSTYGHRLEIRYADILTYTPPKKERYQCVWHDIWADICLDNYEEIKYLNKKYRYRTVWIGAWSEKELKRIKYSRKNRELNKKHGKK